MNASLTFNYENDQITMTIGNKTKTVTKRNTIAKMFQKPLLLIENGAKLNGYVKVIKEPGKSETFELQPNEFKNAIILLTRLGVHSKLIDEEPNKKTKGKYIIVNLTTEQEAELNHLKELHKISSNK